MRPNSTRINILLQWFDKPQSLCIDCAAGRWVDTSPAYPQQRKDRHYENSNEYYGVSTEQLFKLGSKLEHLEGQITLMGLSASNIASEIGARSLQTLQLDMRSNVAEVFKLFGQLNTTSHSQSDD